MKFIAYFLNGGWVCLQSGQKSSKAKLLTFCDLIGCRLPAEWLTDCYFTPVKWPDRIDDREVAGGIGLCSKKSSQRWKSHYTHYSVFVVQQRTRHVNVNPPGLCFAPLPLHRLSLFLFWQLKEQKGWQRHPAPSKETWKHQSLLNHKSCWPVQPALRSQKQHAFFIIFTKKKYFYTAAQDWRHEI